MSQFLHSGNKFRECEMVHAVNVAGSQRNCRKPTWQGLACDDGNMRQLSFSVADQIERLGPGVLHAVAADRPFAGNACMQNGKPSVGRAQTCQPTDFLIHNSFRRVDSRIRLKAPDYNHIGGDGVVVAQRCGKLRVFACRLIECNEV